eukprot:m51a1_g9864 hypothetical protein (161) ;mRNA; f:32636-36683
MDCTSDITIHIDETITEGILDDLGHSGDRFDKKKFVMKATTKGIRESGSNDRFKKLQEQIKQSCWGEFGWSPNHNKEDCPNVKGKAPMASSTTLSSAPACQNIDAQLDSRADRMMINIKYVKKLQWDNHVCALLKQVIMYVHVIPMFYIQPDGLKGIGHI